MVAINDLVELLGVMRAHGVLEFETPELRLKLGAPAPQVAEAEQATPERSGMDSRVEAALRRMPPAYSDPRLWSLGDRV